MRRARVLAAGSLTALAVVLVVAPPAPADEPGMPLGEGSMVVHDSDDCAGSGNDSVVSIPFSLEFRGFEPNATGTVSGYRMPSGELVGSKDVTLGPDGGRCVLVTGDAEPGNYKIVYDFGSGTGKQKVIRLVGPSTPTPSPSESDSPSASPTTPSPTDTGSETPTDTGTPTDTATGSAGPTESETAATGGATPGVSETTASGRLRFTPLPVTAGGGSDELAASGGASGSALRFGLALLVLGALAVLVTNARHPARRH